MMPKVEAQHHQLLFHLPVGLGGSGLHSPTSQAGRRIQELTPMNK
jgi:hypothetical protein